jgi:hypothetical protein
MRRLRRDLPKKKKRMGHSFPRMGHHEGDSTALSKVQEFVYGQGFGTIDVPVL